MSFRFLQTYPLQGLKIDGHLYEHSSGAKLIFMECNDNNKVFSLSFKTPAQDDTGVAHIVEHCLFCGSEKYPVKDPFSEVSKSSMHTYLNAMTFRAMTMYPVASCNEKDFSNLVGIYLDAVFFPLIRKRPESFRQEGWNFQFDESGNITGFGGIVFNEMQGVYSDPMESFKLQMYKKLFPGTQYAFDAAGVPEDIPDLEYDKYIEYYEKHYTPSNCYIYLYGNMDIRKYLDIINEYLSKFSYAESKVSYVKQAAFESPVFYSGTYEYGGEESIASLEKKKYTGVGYCLNTHDKIELMALRILRVHLLGTPSSPLKRSMLEGKIGESIIDMLDDSISQEVFAIIVKNSDRTAYELKGFIDSELRKIIGGGIDREMIMSVMDKFEFTINEERYGRRPRGLVFNIKIMTGWMSGRFPFESIDSIECINLVRERFTEEQGYFESLIEKLLLNNMHCSCIDLSPVRQKAGSDVKLRRILKEMTSEKLDKLRWEARMLEAYRDKEDSPEELNCIPLLEIDDVRNENFGEYIKDTPVNVEKFRESSIYHAEVDTNGIVYMDIMFDASSVPLEFIPYMSILNGLFTKLPTKNYEIVKLTSSLNSSLGGLYTSFKNFNSVKSMQSLPRFILRAKALSKNASVMMDMAAEVLLSTLLVKEKIREILVERCSNIERLIMSDGQEVVLERINSYFYESSVTEQNYSGLEFYFFLKKLIASFDDEYELLTTKISELKKILFSSANLEFAFICTKKEYQEMKNYVVKFISLLPDSGEAMRFKADNKPVSAAVHSRFDEGIVTSSKVCFVAKGINLRWERFKYSGKMALVSAILDSEYLLKEVRINGGAYGCQCRINRRGLLSFFSYRDPNLSKTLEVYDKAFDFLRNYRPQRRELQKIIIGVASKYLRPKHFYEQGEFAISSVMVGMSRQDLLEEISDILSATVEDIADTLRLRDLDFTVENYNLHICVCGNEEKIKNSGMFTNILYVKY